MVLTRAESLTSDTAWYDSILQRAERMPKAKRYRFSRDGYERWLKEDKDFLA